MAVELPTWPTNRTDAFEEQWRKMVRRWFTNGVWMTEDTDNFKVTADGLHGMDISIGTGEGQIEGEFTKNEDDETLTMDSAHGSLNRYDLVVLRLAFADPATMYLERITGVASSSPLVPAPVDDDNYLDVPLARITVGAGVSSISAASVLDLRQYCEPRYGDINGEQTLQVEFFSSGAGAGTGAPAQRGDYSATVHRTEAGLLRWFTGLRKDYDASVLDYVMVSQASGRLRLFNGSGEAVRFDLASGGVTFYNPVTTARRFLIDAAGEAASPAPETSIAVLHQNSNKRIYAGPAGSGYGGGAHRALYLAD